MQNVICFIDAPDPDNFVQLVAVAKLFPDAAMHVVLTGRPVHFSRFLDYAEEAMDGKSVPL